MRYKKSENHLERRERETEEKKRERESETEYNRTNIKEGCCQWLYEVGNK